MATSVDAKSGDVLEGDGAMAPHMDICSPLPPVKAITRSSVHLVRPYTR